MFPKYLDGDVLRFLNDLSIILNSTEVRGLTGLFFEIVDISAQDLMIERGCEALRPRTNGNDASQKSVSSMARPSRKAGFTSRD